MKRNGLWKQQWKSVVSASSVKATVQQQALPQVTANCSWTLLASYILISQPAYLKHHYLLEQQKTNNSWHLKDWLSLNEDIFLLNKCSVQSFYATPSQGRLSFLSYSPRSVSSRNNLNLQKLDLMGWGGFVNV